MSEADINVLNTDTYQEPEPLNTDTGTTTAIPSVKTAQTRAAKADYGLAGVTGENYTQLVQAILGGNEDSLRKQAAARLEALRADKQQKQVTDLLSGLQQHSELRPQINDEVNRILSRPNTVDPRSVIEEGFSRQIIDALNWNAGTNYSTLDEAAKTQLEEIADHSRGLGQSTLAYNQYAYKRYQDMEDLEGHIGLMGTLTNRALNLSALYTDLRQRGLAGLVPSLSSLTDPKQLLGIANPDLLLGNTLDKQYDDILSRPFDEAKDLIDANVDRLKGNPEQAKAWLAGLMAPSTAQRQFTNLNTVLAPFDVFGIAKGTQATTRAILMRRAVDRAVRSQIAAVLQAPADKPPNVVGPGAAGDLQTATLNQTAKDAQDLVAGVKDASIKQGLDNLLTGLKDQIKDSEADPGRLGQEGVSRIKEDTLAFMQNFIRGVTNVLKVERIPGFTASKEAVKIYYNKIKDLYPGFKNSLLDMGSLIEWNPPTNTYHMPFYFGDGANYFDHAQTAYNKAVHEGLVPAQETQLYQINKLFGERSSMLTKKINDLKSQIREPSGPSAMEVDTDAIRKELKATEAEFDDLMGWHSDALTGDYASTAANSRAMRLQLPLPEISEVPLNKRIMKENPGGFTIGQQGNGYYIKIVKPVNEVEEEIRKWLLNPDAKSKWGNLVREDNTTPHGFFKDVFGWARTPEEVFSAMHAANRKVASYAPSVFMRLLKDNADYLESLYSGVTTKDPVTGENLKWVRNRGLDALSPSGFGRFVSSRAASIAGGNYLRPTISRLADTTIGKKLFANGTRWNRFVRILDQGRLMMDDVLDENGLPQQGYFYKTPGEFERAYAAKWQTYPDKLETAAYFAFRRHYEADKMLRELVLYKNASRLGTEEHSIKFFDENKNAVESPYFAGIHIDHMPGGDDTMAVFNNDGLQWKGHINEMDQNTAAKRREDVKSGKLKVIRIFAADQRPLNGFAGLTDEKIHYVLTPNAPTTRPLQLGNMLPRRGGGHFVYDYDHYIKQAIVRPDKVGEKFNHWYEGDATIMPIDNRAKGRRIAGHLDQVRQYLKDGDVDNAKRYSVANLPMSWEEVRSWFQGQKTPDGRVLPPRLSMEEPIQVVPRNKTIGQIDNKLADRYAGTFKDGTKGGSPAESLKVQFTGERDADLMYTINDTGTASNPIYKYEPAELLDPMVTLQRSLKQISESYFMDDYKIYAAEHWLQDAWQHLDVARTENTKEEIFKSPMYYFYNGKYKPGALAADFNNVSSLEMRRFQIKQFMGTPGIVQSALDAMSQQLADAAYEDRFFQRTVLGNHVSRVPSWMMHNAVEPFRKLRTAAYHAIIGTFNWAQLIAQSMNYVTMAGIAGSNSLHGSIGAMLHQYARLLGPSEEMLSALDKVAVNVGLFKPGEWTEAYRILADSGYEQVEGSHMMLDRIYTPRVVSNGLDHFIDAGGIFFRGGEANARFGAHYTAYREARLEKPVGRLTNLDRVKILDRADFLSGNMSRASRSLLQTGIGELPTQFLGYTMRVAEQFTGHRLGWKARVRMVAAFATAFGLPQATSLTGFPMDKYFRQDAMNPNQIDQTVRGYIPGYKPFMQYAFNNGYVIGENFFKDMVMQGVPSLLVAIASGAGDWKKGVQLNIGQRFGSPGMDIIRDALNGDRAFKDIIAGASGSFLKSVISSTAGFQNVALDMIHRNDHAFKLKLNDVTDLAKMFSAGAYAWRSIHAINTMKWLSKNETILAKGPGQDIRPVMAAIMGLTGTQPQQVADLDIKSISHKNDLEQQKQAETAFIKEYNRAAQALSDGDGDSFDDFKRRAYWILEQADYPSDKRQALIHRAQQGWNTSLIDRLNVEFNKRNVPPSQKKGRRDQYDRSRAIELYKEQ